MELLEKILWGWHVLLLIAVLGIRFSFGSGFFQLRRLGFWLKTAVAGSKHKEADRTDPRNMGMRKKSEISQFQAISTALAGSIGTGNIVGVASAITIGGAGALFWMWISAIFGMMTIFAENLLSAKYPNAKGALGYIERVKSIGKPLACVYAAGCFLSSLGMGNMVQANAAASAFASFGVSSGTFAPVVCVLLFLVALGGMQTAVRVTEKLVPAMTIIFFAASLAVLVIFRSNLPSAMASIFKGAFSLKAGAGGVAGCLIAAKTGISRGIFTNEAGLGSAAFSYDGVEGKSPVQIGCMGIFQVFVDTIVMCTVTGLCILCCDPSELEGARLTIHSYESALGSLGGYAISLCTILFAFATMVTWCCYGQEGLFYLTKGKGRIAFALLYAAAAYIGCTASLETVFQIGDAFNGLMAMPNVLALLFFSKDVLMETKRFEQKRKRYHKLI